MSNSFLFIPDITGFTEFVSATEIEHGQHIISELLEIIVNSNQLDMEVSEVEGDAVMFYRFESVPTYDELIKQSKIIFLNFQNHLKLYESQRICECGACTSASSLSIKFISHIGEIGFTTVLDHKKPFGADLILAHNLLKNAIDLREYILISDRLSNHYENHVQSNDWIEVQEGSNEYEKIGVVNYKYIPLMPLRKEVGIPAPPTPPKRVNSPYKLEIFIDKPLYYVFEMVLNLDLRLRWYKGVKEFDYTSGRVNRVGTRHRCLFDSGFADFETITNDFGKDKLVYGERLLKIPIAREVSVYYIMSAKDNGTLLRLELHIVPLPIVGLVLKMIIAKRLMKGFRKLLNSLKEVSEFENEIIYDVKAIN